MPLTFSPPIAAVRQVPISPGDATKFLNGATPPAFTTPAGGGGSSAYTINPQVAPYTFVLGDAQKLVTGTSGVEFTIPANADVAFPVGTWIDLFCDADWNASNHILAAVGVDLGWSNSDGSGAYIYGGQTFRLIKIATNEWYMTTIRPIFGTGIVLVDGLGQTSIAAAGTDYVAPGGAGTVVADTGWTANADSGDKTDVIPSSATLAGYAAALDLVASGLGAAFVNTAEKVKAIEAALAAGVRPNA